MREFEVIGKSLTIHKGAKIILDPKSKQYDRRKHLLKEVKGENMTYEVLGTVSFKKGERIATDADINCKLGNALPLELVEKLEEPQRKTLSLNKSKAAPNIVK